MDRHPTFHLGGSVTDWVAVTYSQTIRLSARCVVMCAVLGNNFQHNMLLYPCSLHVLQSPRRDLLTLV